MLRVTTIHANTAGPSARYYTRYLADEGPEGEGRWLGRQAAGLGLGGRVSTEDLEARVYQDLAARRSGEEREICWPWLTRRRGTPPTGRCCWADHARTRRRATARSLVLAFLARRFGSVFVLALAQRAESRSPSQADTDATLHMGRRRAGGSLQTALRLVGAR
ncbi:MAG: hypothetical protein CYG61_01130 [Actinobacteria bacterium]|nr:MAG: hypothetical protein CYG61_01130 [Actinomycetota bacterium]